MEAKEFFEVVKDKLQQFDSGEKGDVPFFINDMEELFDEWDEEV